MGKNKQKGKKQQNVFQVANKHLKVKNKAKPVKTTLKHVSFYLDCARNVLCISFHFSFLQINTLKKEKVENLNQMFTEVQRDMKSVSKSVGAEPKKQTLVVKETPKEAVNVDNAAQLFSQL
ncbi:hypothetical protein NL108_011253 [Boleophthalmus pectinirostris]|nr:hypothetical protein NL108_011253 [Boleophthalmus pectinirostris]